MNLLILLFFYLNGSYGAKILVYNPKIAFSHMNFLGAIADSLQKAGHDVTVLQPIARKFDTTGSDYARVIEMPTPLMDQEEKDEKKDIRPIMWKTSNFNPIGTVMAIPMLTKIFTTVMESVLQNDTLISQLKEEHFDAMVHELFDFSGFVVQDSLGIQIGLGAHSTAVFDETASILGLPRAPGDTPDLFGIAPVDGSFISRCLKYFYSYFSSYFENGLLAVAQDYLNKKYNRPPSVREMVANLSFIFTNSDPLLDFPRPTLHKIVDIGGLGVRKPKELDKKWVDILSERKINILISFGSVVPSMLMPEESKKSIVNVIRRFPDITFIWKYEAPEDGTGKDLPNVHMTKWSPQTDLLASGKIDLFITHGGAGSVMEAATHGVPTIVVPVFGDQMRNARMIQRFGCGLIYNKADLPDQENLAATIQQALADKKMKEQAQSAKNLIANRHFTPEELLVRHVDLALKFPDLRHFNPEARHYNFIQYYNLDVYLFLAVVFYILCYLSIVVFQKCTAGRGEKPKDE